MNAFLDIKEVLPYYKDPTIQEAFLILARMLGMILIIWFCRVLRSIPKLKNEVLSEDGFGVVSPFMIQEHQNGALYFSAKKNRRLFKVMAVFLIAIFILIPLGSILHEGLPSYGLY